MYSILERSSRSPSQPCIKSLTILKGQEYKILGFYETHKGQYEAQKRLLTIFQVYEKATSNHLLQTM